MGEMDTLRAVFDGSREPALFLIDGVVEYQNPAAAELLPQGLTEALRESLAGEEPANVLLEGRLVRPHTVAWGEGVLVLLRGIDRGGLERRFPLLLEDLRSQLNNLMAATHLMAPSLQEQGGAADDCLAILNQSLYRLLRLAQGGQLLQEMAEGQVAFHPGPLDLAGFCRELCAQVESLAATAGQSFAYESAVSSLPAVADEGLLRQLLLELVCNALRAAGAGGSAGVRLTVAGKWAVFTVWDSGEGVDLAALDRIDFTPRPEGGLQIGIDAARYIAALHGGAVMLDSTPHQGTRVTVSLPIQRPEPGMVRSVTEDLTGGFSPALVALSKVLPYSVYRSQEIDD